jgi:RimJ/RimL family protein N-acetyltransferase
MGELTLRTFTADDVRLLAPVTSEFDDFGIKNPLRTPLGNLWQEPGGLIVAQQGECMGSVSWYDQQWGPGEGSRAYGIGISLLPGARGRGIGTWAQIELTRLLFMHTPVNRVEASTDVTNVAEQRALAKAGFTREGVMRGAQWRLGEWHDLVQFSKLRADA